MFELKRINRKAANYAINKWYHRQDVCNFQVGYGIFENAIFKGVILYGIGGNNQLAKSFNLAIGQVVELLRLCVSPDLETSLSKCLNISMKLLKKDAPLVKIVVSYSEADIYIGTIYQASNFYYIDTKKSHSGYNYDNEFYHWRKVHMYKDRFNKSKLEKVYSSKHKYAFAIDKSYNELLKSLSKNYPKSVSLSNNELQLVVSNVSSNNNSNSESFSVIDNNSILSCGAVV